MIKGLSVLFILLLLISCVTPTPYQKKSKNGHHGFVVQKLAEKKYRVTFHGNDETSQERANDFALMRAAQEAQNNSFEYLAVLHNISTTTLNSHITEKTTFKPIKVVKKDGSVVYTQDYSTQFGSRTKKYATTKPRVYTIVEFHKDNYDQDTDILNVTEIIMAISKKYNIKIQN